MIKPEDIKLDSHKVGPTEKYPIGKSGCEMVSWCAREEDKQEVVYVEHDFGSETL